MTYRERLQSKRLYISRSPLPEILAVKRHLMENGNCQAAGCGGKNFRICQGMFGKAPRNVRSSADNLQTDYRKCLQERSAQNAGNLENQGMHP
jgi:hypothetical protein